MINFIRPFKAVSGFCAFAKASAHLHLTVVLSLFFSASIGQTTIWSNSLTGSINSATTPFAGGQSVASNITVSGMVKGTGLTGQTITDRYNTTNWATGGTLSTGNNDYIEFMITPNAGYSFSLAEFAFARQRDANGPRNLALYASLDRFSTSTSVWSVASYTATAETATTVDLTGSAYQNIYSAPVTFRLYGWNSVNATTGQFSINSFSFTGTVSAIAALWQNQIIGASVNSSTSPYTTGQVVATNINAYGLGRGGVTSETAADRYNSSQWTNSGTIDLGNYYEFTIAPSTGYAIDFVNLSFTGQRSDTGPRNYALRSSLDNYGSNIGSIANETGTSAFARTIDLSGVAYQNVPAAVTFRLYGWGADNNGTPSQLSCNDFIFRGTIEEMPALWYNTITGTGINPETSNPYTTGDIVTDANLDVSGITKGAGLTGSSTTDRYNAYHWNGNDVASASSNNDYFEFTLSPHTGYVISLMAFIYTGQRDNSANSPQNFALRTSLDGYANNIGTFTNTGTTPLSHAINLSASSYQDISEITFRIYGWGGSTNTDRRFSINDFAFYGTIRDVPPVANISFFPTASCPRESTPVTIAGENFYGVTSVEFNGVSAQYTVNSPSQITALVPNGASNGQVTVVAAGVTVESVDDFTVYEVTNDVSLLQDDFEDGNISNWSVTNGGWSSSTSSPLTGSRSLLGSSSNGNERWIRTQLTGAPIDFEEGPVRWRFNALASGGTNASNGGVYVWLASNAADGNNDNAQGYALKFEGTNIIFGLKGATESSWTPLYSYNAGSGKKGIEINRTIDGVWDFLTDDDGGFEDLTTRYTSSPDMSIVSGSYFGAFVDNQNGMSLRLDDLEIIYEGRCHVIYYSQYTGDCTGVLWSRERENGAIISVIGDKVTSFVVQQNDTVSVASNQIAKHFTIESSGFLEFTDGKQLTIYRDLSNQGTINSGDGTIHFIGNVDQTFSASAATTLNNVIIDCNGTVSFPSNVVTNIKPNASVSITRGILNTGNNLVLRSTAVGTGSVGTIASGSSLTGQVTLQRFIPNLTTTPVGGNGSWVAVGTPITGATVQQWNETVITTGFAGADFGPAQNYYFNNIQWYNESATGAINNGYTGVTSLSETLQSKKGYFFYTYANLPVPQNLLRVKGNIQQGTFNDTLQYTNNGVPTADGWNLLVNRYPSEVDFKSIAEAGAGGITAYHLFNAETNNYKVYHTNAAGTAPRYIASGQAFFVQATAPNSYLRYQESFKSNQGTAFERDLQESSFAAIKFYKAQNNEDECVLNFNDNATANFENEYDAVKLHSQEPTVAECAFVSADGQLMSIDSRPLGQDAAITIPIYVEMPVSGTYRLRIEQINNLPFGSCLFVEDLVTGNTMPFEAGQELVIVHTGNYSGNRFLIHASPSITTVETNLDCYEAGNGSIALTLPEGEWTLSLADTLGNNFLMSETMGLFENLPAGQYIASATNALSNCVVSNKTVTITEPAEMVLTHLSSAVDNCNTSGNAYIEWVVSNATNYDYTVTNQANEIVSSGNTGSGAVMVDGLTAGIYTVNVETYCGTQSFETNLNDTNAVSAQILSDDLLLTLVEGTSQTVSVEQSSVNTSNYTWMLSNGNISESETFTYEFDQPGNYLLKLYAYNDQCVAQDSIVIFVEQVVSISEDGAPAPISFFQTKDSFELYLNLSSQERTRVSVIDLGGREVWAMNTSTQPGKNISIGTGAFASGVYFIRTTVGNEEILNKKFINP